MPFFILAYFVAWAIVIGHVTSAGDNNKTAT